MLVLYNHQPPGQNTGMYNEDSSGQIQAEGHPNIYTGSTCYMFSYVLHRQRFSFIYCIILRDENTLYTVLLLPLRYSVRPFTHIQAHILQAGHMSEFSVFEVQFA